MRGYRAFRFSRRGAIAAAVVAVGLAVAVPMVNHHLPPPQYTPPVVVSLGDYGRGQPLPAETAACEAAGGRMVTTTSEWYCAER